MLQQNTSVSIWGDRVHHQSSLRCMHMHVYTQQMVFNGFLFWGCHGTHESPVTHVTPLLSLQWPPHGETLNTLAEAQRTNTSSVGATEKVCRYVMCVSVSVCVCVCVCVFVWVCVGERENLTVNDSERDEEVHLAVRRWERAFDMAALETTVNSWRNTHTCTCTPTHAHTQKISIRLMLDTHQNLIFTNNFGLDWT